MRRRRLLAAACALAGGPLAGCGIQGDRSETAGGATGTDVNTSVSPGGTAATPDPVRAALTPSPAGAAGLGVTHLQPTGNRVLPGTGSVPDTTPVEYDTNGRPVWLVALPRESESGSVWAVATADGTVRLLTVADGEVTDEGELGTLPGEVPFALVSDPDPRPVDRPSDASRWTHPVPVGNGGLLYVDDGGGIVLTGEETGRERRSVGALPDARIVRVAGGRYALLGGATGRYAHGALGDETEASSVVLADVRDGLSVTTPLELDAAVVEGIAPIAADLTGDGTRDLVVTVADGDRGARHVVVSVGGERLATGPSFSTGFRWRHALAVAPFGPDDGVELAAVETPHIGGSARFHRRRGDALEVVAAVDGVSSHALGSRNLDGGLAGDLDGDETCELLVPTQRRDELVAVRRVRGGAEAVWRLDLPGELASNVTGVTRRDGGLAVGAGGTDGTVRIWSS